MSKGHSTYGPKITSIRNLKKPTCASKRDVLELAILQYVLRKDVWDAGFSENKRILFTLFVNALFVCNVPIVEKNIVKMNRP